MCSFGALLQTLEGSRGAAGQAITLPSEEEARVLLGQEELWVMLRHWKLRFGLIPQEAQGSWMCMAAPIFTFRKILTHMHTHRGDSYTYTVQKKTLQPEHAEL